MLSQMTLTGTGWVLLQGFLTGAGLIIAIGAQNAFLLAQGIRRRFHWQIALLCMTIDAVLITAGVIGVGLLISQSELLLELFRWGGIVFLSVYGIQALRSACQQRSLEAEESSGPPTLAAAVAMTLAVSVLNPHVYLDTMVLVGSISNQFEGVLKYWFGGGAVLASICWFMSLALAAPKLAPVFRSALSWRILDLIIAVIMFSIALMLLFY